MALRADRLRLYLVTDSGLCAEQGVADTVAAALQGGVSFVQLRDKTASTRARVELATALKAVLADSGVPLVVNDDVEAAVAAGADGVHLGQQDMSPAEARARLGPDRIVGLSCESANQVRAADPATVDYLGIGAVFPTPTKADHNPAIGFDGLARLCALSPLPTVAIGGLKAEHAAEVLAAGADGLAVVSAICGQPDPEAAARAFFSTKGGRG